MRSPGSDWVVERVLTCVEQVPPGRVVAYGEVGEIVGVGPRQVGAATLLSALAVQETSVSALVADASA